MVQADAVAVISAPEHSCSMKIHLMKSFLRSAMVQVDAVAVVSAPGPVQRERVLARPGMSEERLGSILARQVPDADKRAKADFVIDTVGGRAACSRDHMTSPLHVIPHPCLVCPHTTVPTQHCLQADKLSVCPAPPGGNTYEDCSLMFWLKL